MPINHMPAVPVVASDCENNNNWSWRSNLLLLVRSYCPDILPLGCCSRTDGGGLHPISRSGWGLHAQLDGKTP